MPESSVINVLLIPSALSTETTLTIGIGDGGNEVGLGDIRDAVKKFVPYGREC
mgnify:CR=1 FL=1